MTHLNYYVFFRFVRNGYIQTNTFNIYQIKCSIVHFVLLIIENIFPSHIFHILKSITDIDNIYIYHNASSPQQTFYLLNVISLHSLFNILVTLNTFEIRCDLRVCGSVVVIVNSRIHVSFPTQKLYGIPAQKNKNMRHI